MLILNYCIYFTIKKIFADKQIRYAGQAIGLLLARDKYTAFGARSKVQVTYDNVKQPILDIRDVVPRSKLTDISMQDGVQLANLAMPCRGINAQTAREMAINGMNNRVAVVEADDEGEVTRNVHEVKGDFETHGQYHFHMETQICLCVPNEDGMDVYSSTQHMDSVQVAVAGNLKLVLSHETKNYIFQERKPHLLSINFFYFNVPNNKGCLNVPNNRYDTSCNLKF